jgi:hypothetical protein
MNKTKAIDLGLGVFVNPVKFPLGKVVITSAAHNAVDLDDIHTAVWRHARGDWGDVCGDDQRENERGLKDDHRLFSVYHAKNKTRFFVITEHDRSVTTVLLPEDY